LNPHASTMPLKNTEPINLYDCISEYFKTDTLDA